eukprot:SAG11_NODE_9499_length_906_cov_1.861214_1_plen_64_part_01
MNRAVVPRYSKVVKPTVGTWKNFPRPIFFTISYNPVDIKKYMYYAGRSTVVRTWNKLLNLVVPQ